MIEVRRTNKIQSVEYKRSAKSLGHHDVLVYELILAIVD